MWGKIIDVRYVFDLYVNFLIKSVQLLCAHVVERASLDLLSLAVRNKPY